MREKRVSLVFVILYFDYETRSLQVSTVDLFEWTLNNLNICMSIEERICNIENLQEAVLKESIADFILPSIYVVAAVN